MWGKVAIGVGAVVVAVAAMAGAKRYSDYRKYRKQVLDATGQ